MGYIDFKTYIKPEGKNKRELLTPEDMVELLEGYEEMDIDDIPIHSIVRYISHNKSGTQQFYYGGMLYSKNEKSVKLTNKTPYTLKSDYTIWSVYKGTEINGKIQDTIFFKKIENFEIEDSKIIDRVDKLEDTISNMTTIIEDQQREILKLKKYIKKKLGE